MINSYIKGITHYVPEKVLTNHDLSKMMDTSDDWIRTRTGIHQRHTVGDTQLGPADLAARASEKLFSKYSIDKDAIDFVVFATSTPDYFVPGSGSVFQAKLGLENVGVLDIRQGCAGFIYALKLAETLLNDSKKNLGLIICSDTYTKYIKKSNKSCKPIFSDASASILLKKRNTNAIGPFDFGVDGSGFSDLLLKNNSNDIFMNGPKIAIFTLNKIPTFIKNFTIKNKINKKTIKLMALHQASKYVCEKIQKKLNLNKKIFYNNFQKYGNTVSASIPLLLENAYRENKLKKNDLILACGFGVGLSWGIVKIKWTQKKQ